jgi:D-lactate dehydrogenase (cytochrome)
MRLIRGREAVAEQAADLLADESSLSGGWADEAAWPTDAGELASYMEDLASRHVPATPSGGNTGIAAGAVPAGGAVVSTAAMGGIDYVGGEMLRAGAGVTLEDIGDYLGSEGVPLFYPPDPTEATATVGGTLATDASGSDSYLYGSTRRWVEEAELVLAGGRRLRVGRGRHIFDESGACRVPGVGTVRLPEPSGPPLPKNAAGYWMRPGMDLLDLLIGSEGTLGVFTEAVLRLHPRPAAMVDLAVFPRSMEVFWRLLSAFTSMESRVRAVEMMDGPCLDLLRRHPPEGLPALPDSAEAAVLFRAEAGDDDGLDALLAELDGILTDAGVPPEETWGGFEETEHRRMLDLRHSLPETVNELVSAARRNDPAIHKLGSDSAVDPGRVRELYRRTRDILEEMDLPHLVFGHVGQGHLHANVIPEDDRQLKAGEEAMRRIAKTAAGMGGTVSAEHGLGRLKADFLRYMRTPQEIEGMRAIRRSFDPDGLLCPAITWA